MTRRQVLLALAFFVVAATVVSFTIGRDIYAGRSPELDSFITVHFAGYLFFIVMPVEVLVPWYLAEGHASHVLVLLAIGTAAAAQAVDYGIGRVASGHIVEGLISERRLARAQATIQRYGHWAIFLFNLSPFSSPIVVAAAGVVRFGIVRTLVWSVAGLTLKYVALVWVFGGAWTD